MPIFTRIQAYFEIINFYFSISPHLGQIIYFDFFSEVTSFPFEMLSLTNMVIFF